MKVQQSVVACLLFLLLGAGLAAAAPTAEPPAAEPAAAVELRPADLFGVSVLSAAGDCGKAVGVTAVAGDPWSVCGSCSQSPCAGASVWSVCGYAAGQFKYCQDWLGSLCPREDGARCRCSSDPIP